MFRERTSEFAVQNLSSHSFKLIIIYSYKRQQKEVKIKPEVTSTREYKVPIGSLRQRETRAFKSTSSEDVFFVVDISVAYNFYQKKWLNFFVIFRKHVFPLAL